MLIDWYNSLSLQLINSTYEPTRNYWRSLHPELHEHFKHDIVNRPQTSPSDNSADDRKPI
jgi:hypothetical protein